MYFPLGENFTNDTGGLSSSAREQMNNPVITLTTPDYRRVV